MVYAVVEDRIDVSFSGSYDGYCFHIFLPAICDGFSSR